MNILEYKDLNQEQIDFLYQIADRYKQNINIIQHHMFKNLNVMIINSTNVKTDLDTIFPHIDNSLNLLAHQFNASIAGYIDTYDICPSCNCGFEIEDSPKLPDCPTCNYKKQLKKDQQTSIKGVPIIHSEKDAEKAIEEIKQMFGTNWILQKTKYQIPHIHCRGTNYAN